MIRLPAQRAVFVHIPKTGGTSIARALAPYSERGARTSAYSSHEGGMSGIHDRPGIDAELPAGWLAFAVVRDPAARLSSMFRHHGNPPEGFASWCRWLRGYDSANPFYSPQVAFLNGVDRRLRFESLLEDWADLSTRLFGEPMELPHENKARAPRQAIDYELARYWAREIWPEDVAELGYD